jgi:hypothetical protein
MARRSDGAGASTTTGGKHGCRKLSLKKVSLLAISVWVVCAALGVNPLTFQRSGDGGGGGGKGCG